VSPVVFLLVVLWSGVDMGGCIGIEGDGSAVTIGMETDDNDNVIVFSPW